MEDYIPKSLHPLLSHASYRPKLSGFKESPAFGGCHSSGEEGSVKTG